MSHSPFTNIGTNNQDCDFARDEKKFYMNTPTPEVDAEEVKLKSRGNWHGEIAVVGSDFARKLEQERDDAIHMNSQIMNFDTLTERDQLRKVCDELATCVVYHELENETDDNDCKKSLTAYSNLPHVKAKGK